MVIAHKGWLKNDSVWATLHLVKVKVRFSKRENGILVLDVNCEVPNCPIWM